MNAIIPKETPKTGLGALAQAWLPQTFEQLLQYAECLSKSGLAPVGFHGKPEACVIAIQYGASLNLHPMQALQNIAVINGKPCLYGDSLLALVKASGLLEYCHETDNNQTAACQIKRKGEPELVRAFSMQDAQQAGLLQRAAAKGGPWRDYPARMRQMRARGLALRDAFPDVLMGLNMAEEVRDYDLIEGQVHPAPKPLEKPDYAHELFTKNLPQWRALIESGKRSAQDIINMVQSRYQLSDEQKAQIQAQPMAEPEAIAEAIPERKSEPEKG